MKITILILLLLPFSTVVKAQEKKDFSLQPPQFALQNRVEAQNYELNMLYTPN